ncbi:2Fe-2S iron-sulfur cluster-binding protein [Bradyrhizobium sp. Pha-3]|uniref:2Fe-2S iron-sulfur cluster-binding protein n=1 Tax=Bradyrhizobium sp. Pha-3 TaxID=208375 RepID=UPI0035D43338
MARIVFRTPQGTQRECEAEIGETLMAVARNHAIPGIEAECGGALSCGTCHVYLSAPATAVLPGPSEAESSMLEVVAAERRSDSRLACQIAVTPDLSGSFVEIPATQF